MPAAGKSTKTTSRVPAGARPHKLPWLRVHEEIARTALDVMGERGYHSGLRRSLGNESYSRNVYRHYPDSVALAVAAIEQLPSGTDWIALGGRDELNAAIYTTLASPFPFAMIYATALAHRQDIPDLLASYTAQVLAPRRLSIAAWLRSGKRAGWARPDANPWIVEATVDGALLAVAAGRSGPREITARTTAVTDAIWAAVSTDTENPSPLSSTT